MGNNISAKRRKRIDRLKKVIGVAFFLKENGINIFCIIMSVMAVFTLGKIYNQQGGDSNPDAGNRNKTEVSDNYRNVTKQYAKGENTDEKEPVILPEYSELYEENHDMAGWLHIEGTVIDYPVMQTVDDEEYYIHLDFSKNEDPKGCLFIDDECVVGKGTAGDNYNDGEHPTTNILIHGHTMKSGEMFGSLNLYEDEEYCKAHNIICFDSIYEKRKYEVVAVFYSQVYRVKDDVFKYYRFVNADNQKEFDDWYENIKDLSVFDTGVTAKYGDEFITLSCCAYHVENGRFAVVAKRIE